MNRCCSGFGVKHHRDKFNISFENTDKGIQIKVEPKDQSKVKSFHKFVEASQEFCDCDCC